MQEKADLSQYTGSIDSNFEDPGYQFGDYKLSKAEIMTIQRAVLLE